MEKWEINRRGIVSVVTGGGKTLFSFFCISKFKTDYPLGKVVIIVPTLTLLDQWLLSIIDEFGISADQISIFSGEEKPDRFKQVNILVINTARKKLKDLKTKDQCLLIVDECHRAGSLLNSQVLEGNYGATLGLSATPKREYDSGLKKYLIPSLGPIIYEYGYLEALKDSVIVPFALKNVKIDLLNHEKKEYDRVTQKLIALMKKDESVGLGIDRKIIQRLMIKRSRISSSALNRVPLSVKLAEMHKSESLIIFHESIEGANSIHELFNKRGISSVLYHSKIGPDIRRDNLRLFKKGIFRVLITCKALDEGMNVPQASIAIIASSTASTRQRIQRLGRVLRPSRDKQDACIYTIYATKQEHQRLIKEYQNLAEKVEIQWIKSDLKLYG